jgi:cysteine desulfurase family protein
MKIYLDNAATSYPKPASVYSSVLNYMMNIGSNPGRGGYSTSLEGGRIVYQTREALMRFFNFHKPENVIFTPNVTTALNLLIKSVVQDGFHILATSMEHNSVLRPLTTIKARQNVEVDILECSKEGLLNIDDFKMALKSNTKLVVMSHASNIIGTLQPIEEIGKLCRERGIYFIVDAAQTAGAFPLDFISLGCSALAFTGHKGLLGPQGVGGFILTDEMNEACASYIEGGTGSLSDSIIQPTFLPDKFESGTLNTPAIAGLLEGIRFIEKEGINTILEKEQYLTEQFMTGLSVIKGIEVYGLKDILSRAAVISINARNIDNSELGFILDHEFGIMARTGLHCAPLAHKTVGTYPKGSIRFSFGPFNEPTDIHYALDSLDKILRRM